MGRGGVHDDGVVDETREEKDLHGGLPTTRDAPGVLLPIRLVAAGNLSPF